MGIIAVEREGFPEQELGGGVIRWTVPVLYEEHHAQISMIQHPPGKYIDPHSHTVDEVILMLEGQLTVDGIDEPMPKGSVIFIGANNVYGFQVGPEGLTWIFVRPSRPDVDIAKSDIRQASRTVQRDQRTEAHSASAIEALAWRPVGDGNGLSQRDVVTTPGYPRVSFYKATADNNVSQTAGQAQFLYVMDGALEAEGHAGHAGGLVSIPKGTTYTPRGQGGEARYWMVERAIRD